MTSPPALPQGRLYAALRALDLVFGRGVDDAPAWLLTVRINVVLVLVLLALTAGGWVLRSRRAVGSRDVAALLALTLLAALWRFAVAPANLLDFGGIPYSRMLLGYAGHFGAAQLYSPFYQLGARDIEHAILFNRIAGVLTVPLVYALCRFLQPAATVYPVLAAFLFAVSPLHILFSASDALAVPSLFLTALGYVLIAAAGAAPGRLRAVSYLAGFAVLALLTQVRYENALFLIPAAFYLAAVRRGDLRAFVPGVALAALLLAVYAFEALRFRLTYQNPINLRIGAEMVATHLLRNPFLALPVLFAGTAVCAARRRWPWGVLVLLVWIPALALPVLAESGHGSARVFCSWLILILPGAADGYAALLSAASPVARLAGAAAAAYLAIQPVLLRGPLATQYLEMREHLAFRTGLGKLPAGVRRVIVPDDELLRRRTHSTTELERKYAMILQSVPARGRPIELVGLTDYLADPPRFECERGACVFFAGLPCLAQEVYSDVPPQCAAVVDAERLAPFASVETRAAPFVHCSIYAGALRDQICAPAMRLYRFAWYRLPADFTVRRGAARDLRGPPRSR